MRVTMHAHTLEDGHQSVHGCRDSHASPCWYHSSRRHYATLEVAARRDREGGDTFPVEIVRLHSGLFEVE